MTTDVVVLDTHVLLWWLADDGQLSHRASAAIESSTELVISSITFWEVAMLVDKQRVALDRPLSEWVRDVLAADAVRELPVDARTGVAAAGLSDFHGDPADRVIVATAELLGAPLVTKDRAIRAWAKRANTVRCLW